MSRLPTPGGDDGTWGDVLNDFLTQEHNADGTQKTLPVSKGGTGGTDAAIARTNLGAATDSNTVHLSGVETITGAKTFSAAPVVPSASFPESAVANLTTDLSNEAALRAAGDTTKTINTQTANYTLALADAGSVVEANSASAITVTVPPNSAVAFPVGTVIQVRQQGAGQLSLVAGAGVTLDGAVAASARYATLSIHQRVANEWVITGTPATGTFMPILNAGLLGWAYSQSFSLVSATRDGNEAITTASVVWPDGSTGTFTTDTASTAFPGAIDAYHVTYVPASGPTKTVMQTAVTRDSGGAVIAQPGLGVA